MKIILSSDRQIVLQTIFQIVFNSGSMSLQTIADSIIYNLYVSHCHCKAHVHLTNAQSWKGVYCAIEMMTLYTRGVVCKQTLMLIGMYPLGLETGAQTSIRLYSMYGQR